MSGEQNEMFEVTEAKRLPSVSRGYAGRRAPDSYKANARRSDPDTSHAAARSLSDDKLRESQGAVLGHFVEHGPMTDLDLGNVYDGPPQSPSGLRTRRSELVGRGLLEDAGTRKRLTSGRYAIVWRVVR